MIDKVAISFGGLAVIGTSIAAVATNGFGLWKEIPWYSLSEDDGFNTKVADGGAYKGKFGETYSKYLTGLDNKNKEWWIKKFEEIKDSKPTSGKFKEIKDGNSLKSKCEEAYKEQENNFGSEDTKFKKEEVWKFCSKGGKQPKTIKEFNDGKTSGKEEYLGNNNLGKTKEDKLLSIKSADNQWIWDLKNKEFFNAPLSDAGHFKKFYTDNKDKREKTIKDGCKDAYGKQKNESASDDTKLTEQDVLKWCSL